MGKPVDQPRAEATRLGSYEIVRKLARGGMAELFLARTVGPEGFEKLVVLKKILPKHAENPKFVRLFLDEARLAATLDHPHIAHVYDMGKVDGHYFFTMEYVHGQDVRTTMRRTSRTDGAFPLDHAVQITRNVAAALHYAHERRRPDGTLLDIVHRDVSPSNILVSYDGAVKLVDFGVAKAATSTVKTRTGTLKGKISYMSPEQAKGAPIDRRSDIFSLGIVLWEMVTAQRLFKADNDLATIQMIINSKPQPPTKLRADCSPELERVVLRALANNLDERYQTAEQLQLDLEELAREQKLKQSTVALRGWMHELFADEIRAWSTAQASGQTLTEHMIAGATEMTTPVSESELYEIESEFIDEDDDEDEAPSGTAAPTRQIDPHAQPTRQLVLSPPPVAGEILDVPERPSVIVNDQAPTLQLNAPPSGPIIIDSGPVTGGTPFPIAPAEWRPSAAEPTLDVDLKEHKHKQILIGSSIAFGLIVLVAMAFGAGDPQPTAASVGEEPEAPTKVEMESVPTRVEMKSVPTPVETGSPQPPSDDTATAPVETSAREVAPPAPAPPPVVEDRRPAPVKPRPKPASVKPVAKPDRPKPADKPKPADRPKASKPYDPNSALPPP